MTNVHLDAVAEATAAVDSLIEHSPEAFAELMNGFTMEFPGSTITAGIVRSQMIRERVEVILDRAS